MTRANTARHSGDEFQARWFWLNAANLLNEQSSVSTVAWETGPQGLDDIRIDYAPPRATPNGAVSRDYVQCKWHVHHGEFGYESLIDPHFVHGTRFSWLQRAYDAFNRNERNSTRYRLLTNWRVATSDPLAALIRTESGALDIDNLFRGKTSQSKAGRVRQSWQSHLSIDDEELRLFASSLSFSTVTDSMEELRARLNDRLAYVGLKCEPDHRSSFLYDDLIIKLHQQGDVEFDEPSFRAVCDREDLWNVSGPAGRPHTLGIRSFMHRFDALEDRCDRLLDLVPFFEGRYLRPDRQWNTDIEPALVEFLQSAVSQHTSIRLVVDAHISIAVAVGRLLNVKSGRQVAMEQRNPGVGRVDWNASDGESGAPAIITTEAVGDGDVVLALSVTHNVLPAVLAYCETTLPGAHRLHAQCADGPNAMGIVSGAHAWRVVEQIAAALRAIPGVPGRRIHLFAAAPNALSFFLGQQLGLGPMAIYEWDFENERGGGYQPGLALE